MVSAMLAKDGGARDTLSGFGGLEKDMTKPLEELIQQLDGRRKEKLLASKTKKKKKKKKDTDKAQAVNGTTVKTVDIFRTSDLFFIHASH